MTVGLIRLRRLPSERWWSVAGYCHCGCGNIVRASLGSSPESAVYNWRFARTGIAIVARAIGAPA